MLVNYGHFSGSFPRMGQCVMMAILTGVDGEKGGRGIGTAHICRLLGCCTLGVS